MMSFLRSPLILGATSALVAAFALLDPSPASACSCAGPAAPEVAIERADIVFEGQPTEVRPLQVDLGFGGYVGAKRFRFEVTRYFKGQLGPSLPVFTVDQESACGRDYALGESHVIYARYTDDGLLTDFACSPSAPSSAAAGALAVLGEGLAPDESYPEDLDTAPAAANDSEVESGIHRVPVTDQPARSCASLASAGSSPLWPTLAAIALAAVRRRPRR